MASSKEIKIIQAAKKEYAAAAAKGDKAGMAAAHAKADKARGYTTTTKVNSQGQYYQSVVSAEPPIARPEPAPPSFNWSDTYMKTMYPDMYQKEPGISVAAEPTAPATFAPDSKPVLRGFYDSRNEMAGGGNPPALSIGNLNINSLPQEKMDNTVRNTILAKAAAQQYTNGGAITTPVGTTAPSVIPSMGEFRQIDQGSIEPTVGDKLGWLGRSLTEGTANRVPAGFINAAGVLTGNLVSDLDPIKGQGVAERERLPFAERIKGFGDKQNEIQGAAKALLQGENISGVIPKPVGEPTQESIQEAEAKRRAVQDVARNILSKADPFEQRAAEIQAQGENYGKGWQLAGGAISAAGDMIPAIAAGLLTKNPAAGMAVFGTQAGGQAAGQAYDETQDFNKAMGYGVGSAALEIGTEMIGGGIPGLGKGLLNPAISKVFKRIAEKPKLAWLLKESVDTVGEGAEEVISGALDPYVQRLTYNPEAEGATAEDLADQFTVGVLASIVLRAGVSVPGKAMSLNDKRNTLNALNELANMLPKETRPERLKFKINLTEEELNQYAESIRSAAMPRATEQTLVETSGESVQPVSGVQPIETPVRAEKPAERFDTGNTASANWKRQGQIVSVHRDSENAIVQPDALETARGVAGNPDYDIVRVNEKTGAITFIKTDDFDGKPEPKIISETTVAPDGNVRVQMPENKIIVDKAAYVPEDYAGFDVAAAKTREKEWRDTRKHGTYSAKDIENGDYFNERAGKVFGNAVESEMGIPVTEKIEGETTPFKTGRDNVSEPGGAESPSVDNLSQNNSAIKAVIPSEYLTSGIVDTTAEHTPEKQKVMEEYIQATDSDIVDLVNVVENLKDKNVASKLKGKILSEVAPEEAEEIKNLTGVDVNDYSHHIDGSGVQHILKRHGKDGEHDHSMSDVNDIARVEYVLKNYDTMEVLKKSDGTPDLGYQYRNSDSSPSQKLLYKKRINGTYYLVEAVPDSGKKLLHVLTAYAGKENGAPQALLMSEDLQLTSKTLNESAPNLYIPHAEGEINIKNDGKAVETVAAKEDNIAKETEGEEDVSKGSPYRENDKGNLGRTAAAESYLERKRRERDSVRERARDIGGTDAGRRIRNVAEISGIRPDINVYAYEHYDDDAMLGFIDTDSNTFDMFISENPDYSIENIAYHELAHKVHQLNQKAINPIIKKIYDNGEVRKAIDKRIAAMADAGKTEQYEFYKENPGQMAIEYFCDIFSNTALLKNGGSWQNAIETDLPLDLVNQVTTDIENFLNSKENGTKQNKPPSSPTEQQSQEGDFNEKKQRDPDRPQNSRMAKGPENTRLKGQIYNSSNTAADAPAPIADSIIQNAPKRYKTKTIDQIKANVIRYFGVNIHSKNYRRPDGIYAYFKPAHNVIHTRYNQAIGIVAHELGHKLDRKYGLRSLDGINQILKNAPGYAKTLETNGYKVDEMPGEVVADFVMMYLTNPDAALEAGGYADGKNFYTAFEGIMSKKDLKNLHDLRRDILMWGAQDSIEKARGMIRNRGNKEPTTIEEKINTVMREVVDNRDAMKQFINSVEDESGKKIKNTDNLYLLARKMDAATAITESMLKDGIVGVDGHIYGRSFGSILKDIKLEDMWKFDIYLKDVHALDWMAQGKRVYNIDMDDEAEIRARITKMEKDHPEFNGAAEDLYQWWRDFTNEWLVGSGLYTQEFVDELHKQYPHYVPNFRVKDGIKGKSGAVGGDPIKAATGSDLPTYSATENLILQIGNIVQSGVRNQAMSTLHTLYNDSNYSETVGLFLDEIPPDVQAQHFDAIGIKDDLTKLGKMTQEEIDDIIADNITQFMPKKKSGDPNVAVAMIDGKAKFYNITDENLARAFLSLEPKQLHGVLAVAKSFTRAFSGVTTAQNPMFAIANHARDIQHGIVMIDSKYHALDPRTYLSYFKDLILAYGDILSNNETYKLYKANVGLASKYMPKGDTFNRAMREIRAGNTEAGRNIFKKAVNEIKGTRAYHLNTASGNAKATVGNLFAKGMDIITTLNETVEAAPRMVAFRRAYNEGSRNSDAILEAVRAAREATVDFQKKGNTTSGLAVAVPFIGASISGINQFREITMTKEAWTTKEGQQRLMRAVITQAIPAVLMAIFYAGDKDWEDLNDYLKNGYWQIKIGPEKFIKIPKEREISAIFNTPFQLATLKYLQPDFDDEEQVAAYLDYLWQNFLPAHEITGWAIFDAINNKRWSGGPIVSQRDEDLMVPGHYDEIYDETTSKLAIFIAKVMKDSDALGALNTPKGIEYVIDQLTGGVGDIILPLTTSSTGGVAHNLLRRYMTDSVYSNKYSNEAYNILADLNADKRSNKDKGIDDEETKTWQKLFNNTLSGQSDKFVTVSDYYAEIRANNNDLTLSREEREEKNREIRKKINAITEKLVRAYKAGGTPEGYSFAEAVVPDEAKERGITDKQYSDFINATTGQDVSSAEKKFILATSADLTEDQKDWLSRTVLDNKSYKEWGPVYESLRSAGFESTDVAKLYDEFGGSGVSDRVRRYNLVGNSALTYEQKGLVSSTLLDTGKYDEWAPAYAALHEAGVSVDDLNKIDAAVSNSGKADTYTHVLKSGKNKGQSRQDSIDAGSKEEKSGVGKSLSWKQKIEIDKAYPGADKETLEALYTVFGVSEKVWGYKKQ